MATANNKQRGLLQRYYVKLSEHIITYPKGIDAANIGYSRRFSVYGDYMDIYQWYPATESFYEDLRNFTQNQTVSPIFGYVFVITPVTDEVKAVSNILSEFLPPLECGLIADVDGAVARLNEKLRDAGINRIIAENQHQYDTWARFHP